MKQGLARGCTPHMLALLRRDLKPVYGQGTAECARYLSMVVHGCPGKVENN